MNERIKDLAEQAGISFGGHPMNPLNVYPSDLERFAELVRQDEREDLAVLAEEVGKELAKAIRGRTE